MASHFTKFKGLKLNMRHTNITDKYMERMIVREHQQKLRNLHPKAKARLNEMTQAPVPLKYKLQPLPEPDFTLSRPLGLNQELPFTVSIIILDSSLQFINLLLKLYLITNIG